MAMLLLGETAKAPPAEMSVEDAAELLNVAPGYVNKLLNEGTLPGLLRDDVLVFKSKEYARQVQCMEELVALTEELGLYDLYQDATK